MHNLPQNLDQIRALMRQGDYRGAVQAADALPEQQGHPLVILEKLRALLRQGKPAAAQAALAGARLESGSPGERLILKMEAAALRIYCEVAIQTALAEARATFAEVNQQPVDPADRAEAERVYNRILLIAGTYHEIPPEAVSTALARLPELADVLEAAGRVDEALSARFTWAEYMPALDLAARAAVLTQLAELAIQFDRPNLAGEAYATLARQLQEGRAAPAEIQAALEQAETWYTCGRHVHGLIDVQRVRSMLAIADAPLDVSPLEACVAAYAAVDFPRGQIMALMDLAQFAHNTGNTRQAAEYRRKSLELAEAVGMGLARDSFLTGQIDLLLRSAEYGTAIELCEAALAANPPLMNSASYEQLMATAFFFVNDVDNALIHNRKSVEAFVQAGAVDSASNSVLAMANNLSSLRQEAAWDEAETLLEEWLEKDKAYGLNGAAVQKLELLAQINIERYNYSAVHGGAPVLLGEAEATLDAADALAERLPKPEAFQRLGNLHSLRGQVWSLRGDEERLLEAWQQAQSSFEQAGLQMEAANCHYILGTLYLNRANRDLFENFGLAEGNLNQALEYYHAAGMRGQAANTDFMLARLYANAQASSRVTPDLGSQMLDAALHLLLDAEASYDAIRREYKAGGTVLDVQMGKRGLIEKSQRIYDLALEILCFTRLDPGEVWNWVQRAKARALSDVLGTGSMPPERILAALAADGDAIQLVEHERALIDRINQAAPDERLVLRQELEALWQRMGADPRYAEYLDLRRGEAVQPGDMVALLSGPGQAAQPCVFVDWFSANDALFLITMRLGSPPERPVMLAQRLSEVQQFIQTYLAPENFRANLRDDPELLRAMDGLIEPLSYLTEPDELLVLSPTGPLSALPLHALELRGGSQAGEPLLVRNPVVYTPSLSVLRHCLARGGATGEDISDHLTPTTAALFGDPSGDRPEAANLVIALGEMFHATPLVGSQVTRQAFAQGISSAEIVHFQGHALHDARRPLDSHLVFADGNLTARDIFGLTNLKAQLVTLAACESAANLIAPGDEPLGLISAFLYAGANAVLATLWKVNQRSAAQTMQLFYQALGSCADLSDKARLLRQAMLAVREMTGFDSVYHWAPYVLYGNWI